MVELRARVEAAVRTALDARPDLDQLIARAVDEELGRLVALELDERRNGGETNVSADPERTSQEAESAASNGTPEPNVSTDLRACRRCGQTKPVGAFEKHRHTCKECRRAQARELQQRRQTVKAPAAPARPAGVTATALLAGVRQRFNGRTSDLTPDGLGRWLVDEGCATIDAGRLLPTARGVELGAALAPVDLV